MTVSRTMATSLLLLAPSLLIAPGLFAADIAPAGTSESNREFLASFGLENSAPDVILSPDTDLLQFTRESAGLAPEVYVAPLIIPAADANGDSQTSDYFYSFSSGLYNLTDGCHMAPAYLPHGNGTTVTVDNFFIFAYDNGASDVTYTLWRKNTLSTDAPTLMGAVSTQGASTSIQVLGDLSIDTPVVSSGYVYYVTWCYTGPSHGILGFWIFYNES